MRRLRSTLVVVASLLLTSAAVGPSVAAGWRASRPRAVQESDDAVASFGPGWRNERLQSEESVWMTDPPESRPMIVMVHGFRQPRTDLRELAKDLRNLKYGVALVRLPYVDGSEPYSGGGREAASIQNLVASLRSRVDAPIVLMGFSAGGFASVLAVSHGLVVEALIVDSAFVSAPTAFRRIAQQRTHLPAFLFAGLKPAFQLFSGGGSLADVRPTRSPDTTPSFVIHCESDDFVLPSNAYDLHTLLGGEVWVAPGDGHGGAWYANPTEYETRVDAFIRGALAPSAPGSPAEPDG